MGLTKNLEVLSFEPYGLIHVLKQSAGSGDENIHLSKAFLLVLDILAADNKTGRERVITAN